MSNTSNKLQVCIFDIIEYPSSTIRCARAEYYRISRSIWKPPRSCHSCRRRRAASPRAYAAALPSKQTLSCFHIVFMECLPHSCQSQYGGQEMWESKTSSSTITVYVRTVNSPALVARSACGAIREGTDDLEWQSVALSWVRSQVAT